MSDNRIAYYPGCSQIGTAVEYDMSTRAVFRALGVDLVDLDDWSCCGSTPAHTVDHILSGALASRNLEIVEKAGHDLVTTGCPSCLTNLKTAAHRLHNDEYKEKVNKLLDEPVQGTADAQSTLQIIVEKVGVDAIRAAVKKPLTGLRVAPYYGCITNRPPEIMKFDDWENPVAMDQILEAIGCDVAPYALKVECCGAANGVAKKEAVMKLTGKLFDAAEDVQAACFAVACPLCQMNLDLRQGQVNAANGTKHNFPVFYFTQLLGLALGIPEKELGLDKLTVDPFGVLKAAAAKAAEA